MYTLMHQLQFLKIQLPFLVITNRLRTTDTNRNITVVQLTLYYCALTRTRTLVAPSHHYHKSIDFLLK